MKYPFLLLLLLFCTTNGFAQTDATPGSRPPQIFTYVDKMPEPGVNIPEFLSKYLRYPEDARKAGIAGRVIIRFIIDSTGEVSNVNVSKSVHPALDSESVRVVKMLPRWQPGEQAGKKVSVFYSLPISFKLQQTVRMALVKPRNGERIAAITRIPAPDYNLDSLIKDQMHYDGKEKELGIAGKVTIKCQLDEKGNISKPEVYRSVYPALDDEALRVVALLPSWKPAYIDDEPVAVYQLIDVEFKDEKTLANNSTGKPEAPLFFYVERMPEPTVNVAEYLQRNLKYPREARDYDVQGRVIVKFVVDEEGHVIGVHTPEPRHFALDREARRVVREMPSWRPGIQDGKPVKVFYTLPISFRLE